MSDFSITNSSSSASAPLKGILKETLPRTARFSGHALSQTASELDASHSTLQKKEVIFSPLTQDEERTSESIRDSPEGKLTRVSIPFTQQPLSVHPQQWLDKSREIATWASNRAAETKQELQEAKNALDYIKKNPTTTNEALKTRLEEWVTVAEYRASKSDKYAQFTQVRMLLIKGNNNLKQKLHENGNTISDAWTLEEMNDDLEVAQAEPWAQPPDPCFDEIRRAIPNLLASKSRVDYALSALGLSSTSQYSRQAPPQKAPTQSEKSTFTQSVSNYPSSHETNDDHGDTFYDIAPSYARHPRNEDGTFNTHITLDMHGAVMRDDTPKPPSDSCIIS